MRAHMITEPELEILVTGTDDSEAALSTARSHFADDTDVLDLLDGPHQVRHQVGRIVPGGRHDGVKWWWRADGTLGTPGVTKAILFGG